MRVVARTSAFRFKGDAPDLREVGEKLNVKTVLEGSIRKAGNRLRINAQLINTEDGYHLWSERYDRDMDDVFAVQDEIARTVVERLKVALLGADAPLVKRQTRSIDAYNLCLRGRFFHAKRNRNGFSQAIECFQLASAKDPDYPQPYADLANVYTSLMFLGWSAPREIMPKVRQLAAKALALDDTVSVAHLVLANVLWRYEWDWSGAEREIRRALELHPRSAALRVAYAEFLAVQGRAVAAAAEARRGLELGPLSLNTHATTAIVQWCAREYDDMIDQAHRMLELEPRYFLANWVLGLAHGMKGLYQEAVTTLEEGRVHAQGDPITEGALGWAYALAGQRERARDLLRDLTQRGAEAYFPAACIAWVHVGLGEHDEAIDWLNKAREQREGLCAYFNVAPLYEPLRRHPRFQDLLRRMNFPQQP